MCGGRSDRFSFWAALPLPHVDAAIAEATRALDELGAVGITLQCFCLGDSIARPRRFFYDTVCWGSKAALAAAPAAFGAERLVSGSDWPILLPFEPYKTTFDHIRDSSLLSDVEKELILHRNVQALPADRLNAAGHDHHPHRGETDT